MITYKKDSLVYTFLQTTWTTKNQMQQITKLSDRIRAKYEWFKYNRISSKDKVNKVLKLVVKPLIKVITISMKKY